MKLLLQTIACLATAALATAALPATAVINIRSTATANNVNGGGFNSARGGTDYSLQDAAQVTGTDGTSNASTTFTSASATFTSQMVGNYLHLTAGTNGTVGWYEIVTFTDANTVELDRNSSTAAMTNGTFYVGGAMSLNSTLDDDLFEIGIAGNTFAIKGGATYTMGESISLSAAGTAILPIIIQGYTTTPGDDCNGSSRPTLNFGASPSLILAASWHMVNMSVIGGPGTLATIGNGGHLRNCKFVNNSTTSGRSAASVSTDVLLLNSEFISYRGIGVLLGSNNPQVVGCYIHDSDLGISSTTNSAVVVQNNIIASCVTAAIKMATQTAATAIHGNTLFGSLNTTGVGVNILTGCTDLRITNNIITGFATGVVHADTQSIGFDNYNNYYNNDADVSAAGQWQKGANDSAVNPGFTNVGQVVNLGTVTAGASDLIVTDDGVNFTTAGVVAGRDYFYLVSGTNCTAGIYGITAVGTTTITLDLDPTSSGTGSSIVYQITTGRNFGIGAAMKALGSPGAFPGGYTTGYMDQGAAQRQESGGQTSSASVK